MEIISPNLQNLTSPFARGAAIVNVVCAGETSWYGFATAIVDGLKARGVKLAADTVVPIKTQDFPTKAQRPGNSRLDLSRPERVNDFETPGVMRLVSKRV
jgi:dTDP-4-dehydrorhamnose reductase